MQLRIAMLAVLCLGLWSSSAMLSHPTYAQGEKGPAANAAGALSKITVYNPMGTPPPITLKPQARRLDTLVGKTIYFINTGYIGTDRLMAVMADWFKANYPQTHIVIRDNASGAGLDSLSQALWTEIAEKGDAAIVGLGH